MEENGKKGVSLVMVAMVGIVAIVSIVVLVSFTGIGKQQAAYSPHIMPTYASPQEESAAQYELSAAEEEEFLAVEGEEENIGGEAVTAGKCPAGKTLVYYSTYDGYKDYKISACCPNSNYCVDGKGKCRESNAKIWVGRTEGGLCERGKWYICGSSDLKEFGKIVCRYGSNTRYAYCLDINKFLGNSPSEGGQWEDGVESKCPYKCDASRNQCICPPAEKETRNAGCQTTQPANSHVYTIMNLPWSSYPQYFPAIPQYCGGFGTCYQCNEGYVWSGSGCKRR